MPEVTALATLGTLRDAGHLTDLDVHLTGLMVRLAGTDDPAVVLAAALASHRTGEGHVCADLAAVAGGPLLDDVPDAPLAPALPEWLAALRRVPVVVGAPGDHTPLVLDAAGRLYLHRYWAYERLLADALLARAAVRPTVDVSRLSDAVAVVFPRESGGPVPDWQRVAAVTAALRGLCVISGGPGTGKTSTVVRLLGVLAAVSDGPLAIRLAAPTGKAAGRLQEAVRDHLDDLPPALRERLPAEASTLHRLLGARRRGPGVRHDDRDPVPADVVVVDEASMVDLALMAKLVRALRPGARLVLLGDRDQLASVEAGAVLGDVCAGAGSASAAFAAELAAVTGEALPAGDPAPGSPMRDTVVLLRHSWRFGAGSGIGRLAAAVNRGDGDGVLAELAAGHADVGWRTLDDQPGALAAALAEVAVPGFAPYCERVHDGATDAEVFEALGRFRVLCAHRHGLWGVERANRLVEGALADHGLVQLSGPWYTGRPVLVTRNDPALRVFNGDVGIVRPNVGPGVRRDGAGGRPSVVFARPASEPLRVPPVRLPPHETVWATTVHKSQGSEFDRVVLVLPAEPSRVVTRALLYTAITRARSRVEVWGSEAVVRAAVATRVERSSGLRDALWGLDEGR
jgi:exodeoxyribonuclease V alpha subunit